jgi:hypothetical protein
MLRRVNERRALTATPQQIRCLRSAALGPLLSRSTYEPGGGSHRSADGGQHHPATIAVLRERGWIDYIGPGKVSRRIMQITPTGLRALELIRGRAHDHVG